MLKQIEIGGQMRPIQFGYGAKRRLDPIIRKMSAELGHDAAGMAALATDIEFQIQLIKVGLEEGTRVAEQKLTVTNPIAETTICDWIDERPEAVFEAMQIYTDQTLTIQAKQNGMEPGEYKRKVLGASSTPASQTGTPSNESPPASE